MHTLVVAGVQRTVTTTSSIGFPSGGDVLSADLIMHGNPQGYIGTAWIVTLVVWLIGAFTAKRTARRQPTGSRWLDIDEAWMAALFLFWRRLQAGPLARRFVPNASLFAWLGVALTIAGLALAITARLFLGGNWSGTVTIKEGHTLVRGGHTRSCGTPSIPDFCWRYLAQRWDRKDPRADCRDFNLSRAGAQDKFGGTFHDGTIRSELRAISPACEGADAVRLVKSSRATRREELPRREAEAPPRHRGIRPRRAGYPAGSRSARSCKRRPPRAKARREDFSRFPFSA